MATTSLSLGPYWENFIKQQIQSGRYGSASEVVRDALRGLETYDHKLQALRAHLAEGARQIDEGHHVTDFSISHLNDELDQETL